jgi:hypothetical protein
MIDGRVGIYSHSLTFVLLTVVPTVAGALNALTP